MLESIQGYSSSDDDQSSKSDHHPEVVLQERLEHSNKRSRITPAAYNPAGCNTQRHSFPQAAELLSEPQANLEFLTAQYVPNSQDQSSKHQGRKRQFPHIEGNFATHVYIEANIPDATSCAILTALEGLKSHVPDLNIFPELLEGSTKPLHLSLSRAVPIRFHQIQPLLKSLKAHLKQQVSFQIQFQGWKVYVNDERSRTFLAVAVMQGSPEVCEAIVQVDQAFQKHQLKLFYKEPSPHLSVAWLLGDHEHDLQRQINAAKLPQVSWGQAVHCVLCCIGQRVNKVWHSVPNAADGLA